VGGDFEQPLVDARHCPSHGSSASNRTTSRASGRATSRKDVRRFRGWWHRVA